MDVSASCSPRLLLITLDTGDTAYIKSYRGILILASVVYETQIQFKNCLIIQHTSTERRIQLSL
jgi:hypothetical protein